MSRTAIAFVRRATYGGSSARAAFRSWPPPATRARDRRRGRWRPPPGSAAGSRSRARRRTLQRIRRRCACGGAGTTASPTASRSARRATSGVNPQPRPEPGMARSCGGDPHRAAGRAQPELSGSGRCSTGAAGDGAVAGDRGRAGDRQDAAALGAAARSRGARVPRRCPARRAEFERDLPFGVWVDALDAYVASQDLDDGSASPIWPACCRRCVSGPARRRERHQVHRAVRALLELLAAERPAVVVLDDLQWSDDASIEVLAAMLRRGIGAPHAAGPRLPLGWRALEARGRARGAGRDDPRARAAERGRLLDAGGRAPRRAAARRGLRAERRQPLLHLAARPGRRAAVAERERRPPRA